MSDHPTRRTVLQTAAAGLALSSLPAAKASQVQAEQVKAVNVVAYNVACGQWATPEQIAQVVSEVQPDIVLMSEVPKWNAGVAVADWTRRVADALEMDHIYVGSFSSAHHRAPNWGDITGNYGGKFKSIASRWPINNTHDYSLNGTGWAPASAIRAEVEVAGTPIAFYSLHVPGGREWDTSMHKDLATRVLAEEPLEHVVVGGDYNNRTDGEIMTTFAQTTGLTNAIEERAIDHILYNANTGMRHTQAATPWGPEGTGPQGYLSDHPYAWARLEW